jgi:trk system potassium uptake protein TrkA
MKIIVIGLGNFGASLGVSLIERGAEVIGVDVKMNKVEVLKDKLTYTICLDTSDELAIQTLPLREADLVVISIGEDIGASLTTTALVKKYAKGKIIGRAINPIHEAVLEAMEIEKIIHPEASFAKELASSICLRGALKTMILDKNFEIVEVIIPNNFIGKTIMDSNIRKNYQLNVITILREEEINTDGNRIVTRKSVLGVVTPETVMVKNDILVLFGRNQDIEAFIEKYVD